MFFGGLSFSILSRPYNRYSFTKLIGAPVFGGSEMTVLFWIRASGGGINTEPGLISIVFLKCSREAFFLILIQKLDLATRVDRGALRPSQSDDRHARQQ